MAKITNNKIIFYERVLKVGAMSFLIILLGIFLTPDTHLGALVFLIIWSISLIALIICEAIFTIGMAINAWKMKKYLWVIPILFLGTLAPIVFYFLIFKKQFKEIGKN